MAILFSRRVFAQTIIDTSAYFSDPSLNVLLGAAEKYCLQLKITQVVGADTGVQVYLQRNNGTDVWPSGNKIIDLSSPVASGTVAVGYELGNTATPGPGRELRLRVELSGTAPKAYVQLWLTGRDGR